MNAYLLLLAQFLQNYLLPTVALLDSLFFLLWKNLVSFICHCKGFLKNTILIFRLSEQVKDCFDSQDMT